MYRPEYEITNSTLNYVAAIEAAKQVIDNSPLIPSWERKFRQDAVVRQVHHSTSIEENSLNYTEVKEILEGKEISVHRDRDVKEIINYREALKYISTYDQELSSDFILGINGIVLKGLISEQEVGQFRKKTVVVMNSKSNEIVFEPPNPDEVELEFNDLLNWYNTNDINPILKSAIIQYAITAIHPFIEGNGRTARLASTWTLYKHGYSINNFFCLEEYYDKDANGYYSALASADETGELTTWLEYFTKGLAIEFERIKEKVLKLSVDAVYRKRRGQVALNSRQIRIIQHIQAEGFLTNRDFNYLFPNISDDTILRELKDLLRKKVLKKSGRTKNSKYFLA